MTTVRLARNYDYRHLLDRMLVDNPASSAMPLFSTFDPDNGVAVFNRSCWAGSLDFTGVGMDWYDGVNAVPGRGGVMITNKHMLYSWHATHKGEVRFITADNTIETSTVFASTQVSNYHHDIEVLQLGADVSDAVTVYPLLPADYADYLGGDLDDLRWPVVFLDDYGTNKHAAVHDTKLITIQWDRLMYYTQESTNARRAAYYDETDATGVTDSGQPYFVILPGDVLSPVMMNFSVNYGPFYPDFLTEIAAAVTSLSSGTYELELLAFDKAIRPRATFSTPQSMRN